MRTARRKSLPVTSCLDSFITNLRLYPCTNYQYSHWMEVSEVHTNLGEAFGFVCWMWIFYRARNDLPVVLGWRHPWEHAEDPWAGVEPKDEEIENIAEMRAEWDTFQVKAENPEEDVSFQNISCDNSMIFLGHYLILFLFAG